MTTAPQAGWMSVIQRVLDRSHLWRPDQLADGVAAEVSRVGVSATIYLVDHEQLLLHALRTADGPGREPLPVEGTVAGHAFSTVRSLPGGPAGWWVPMVNGTDRIGVIEFAGVPPGDDSPAALEILAGLVGHLVTTTDPRGDHLQLMRRSRPMSTASELLLKVLPPLTASTERVVIAAVLEPCYEVGGDGYDYALDGRHARLLVLDAVGRGLRAALACVVVVSAVRAARRAGAGLVGQARAADAALVAQFPDARFATAILAELDVETGSLRYLNAGHPAPLVLRSGKVVHQLADGRRMPLGLEDQPERLGEAALEPGDRLVLYTDGVVDARSAEGEAFGIERLVDLAERHDVDGLPAPESARRLTRAVLDHQPGPAVDDATLLLLEWSRGAAARTVPDNGRIT
jgi:phosphoserine phosphatase RsbU/P